MSISEDEFRTLAKRVDDLDKILEKSRYQTLELHDALSARLQKVGDMVLMQESLLGKMHDAVMAMYRRHDGHDAEFAMHINAYDMAMTHIENLEAKVFPSLKSDLRKLHRVIGKDESTLPNPLDIRPGKPKKKK